MNHVLRAARCFSFSISAFAQPNEPPLPREQWGAPPVNISLSGGKWTIAGPKQSVSLNETSFIIEIHAGPAPWAIVSSTVAAAGDGAGDGRAPRVESARLGHSNLRKPNARDF